MNAAEPPGPSILLYRTTCPYCRLLARVALLASLGTIELQALDSRQAQELYARHPETRGRLALVHGPKVYLGVRTLSGAVRVVRDAVGRRVSRPFGTR
jgi:predicted DCC family thiol-disulfide oxidoreductase YuxK